MIFPVEAGVVTKCVLHRSNLALRAVAKSGIERRSLF
jgi:hypothetical protein